MIQYVKRQGPSRGVVVVVSDSPQFADTVGEMLGESGYSAVHLASSAPAGAAQRLLPCLVISDGEAPAETLERVFAEAAADLVPMLLAQSGPTHRIAQALTVGHRVAWFTFPISREAFRSTLATVLLTPRSTYAVSGEVAGVRIDAGIAVRDLRSIS
jgi:CheY-like chemotaxis protein